MNDLSERLMAAQVAAGEAVQPPASAARIEAARVELREAFGATLPPGYAAFLAEMDGADFDGVVLYGTGQTRAAPGPGDFWQGLAEANRLWRDGPAHDNYLVLGESDLDLLTVDLDGTSAQLRDKVSGDVNERFGSPDEAVRQLLSARL